MSQNLQYNHYKISKFIKFQRRLYSLVDTKKQMYSTCYMHYVWVLIETADEGGLSVEEE